MARPKLKLFGEEEVGVIGFGAMGISEFYGTAPTEEVQQTVEHLIRERTVVDTADMYGWGKNEEFLAPYLAAHRDKIFICTKFGNVRGPNGEWMGIRGDAEYIQKACEMSLQRLGLKQIDLYYQHRVDPKVPIEESVAAMKKLKDEGKVRFLGMSECSAATLKRALAVCHIDAVQMEYSPASTEIETNGIMDICKEHGIVAIAYSPLSRGLFTLAYNSPDEIPEGDFRKDLPRFTGEAFERNLKFVRKFQQVAKDKGCIVGQLCLAWILAQQEAFGVTIIPIPGTKRVKYLRENLGAAEVKLSNDELDTLRKFVNEADIQGMRYSAQGMESTML